jgi:hypothetical protein
MAAVENAAFPTADHRDALPRRADAAGVHFE